MPVSTLTEFHHWLLAEETTGSPFILLDNAEGGPLQCAAAVARHLNEFDEESGGNWISLSEEIILAIASDPAQRQLLGLGDSTSKFAPTSTMGIKQIIVALANRGHIVFDHPLTFEALVDHPKGFRAAIGSPPGGLDAFHIIVNPDRFHARCLAPLIADSFLEWIASGGRRSAA